MRAVFFPKSSPGPVEEDRDWLWWFCVWIPAAIAVGVICIESTATFSAENTSSWLRPVFESVFGRFSDTGWDLFHHYLRKTGHFIGYGMVGFTFLRSWLYTLRERASATLFAWRVKATLLTIVCTALVASGDEFHQTFIPGRTGLAMDALLDTSGVCTFCLMIWLVCWTRRSVQGSIDWSSD
jgi:VanZ family protein